MYDPNNVVLNNMISQPSRHFSASITDHHEFREYQVDVIRFTIRKASSDNDRYTIGKAFSESLEIEFKSEADFTASNFGLYITIEQETDDVGYIAEFLLGTYYVDKKSHKNGVYKITAYNAMYARSGVNIEIDTNGQYSVRRVLDECAAAAGVRSISDENAEEIDANHTYLSPGRYTYTFPQMLGYLAGLCGGNAFIGRYGNIEIHRMTMSGYSFSDDRIKDVERNSVVDIREFRYAMTNDDGAIEYISNINSDVQSGMLTIPNNPLLGNDRTKIETYLSMIRDHFVSYNYGSINFLLGDPRIDPWDIITDEEGHTFNCSSIVLNYDGGMSMLIDSYGSNTDLEDVAQDDEIPMQKIEVIDTFAAATGFANITGAVKKYNELGFAVINLRMAFTENLDSSNKTVCTLPTQYRPKANKALTAAAYNTNAHRKTPITCYITSGGNINIYPTANISMSSTYSNLISITGIYFI